MCELDETQHELAMAENDANYYKDLWFESLEIIKIIYAEYGEDKRIAALCKEIINQAT